MQEFVADEEVGGGAYKQRVLVWAQGIVMWITYIARPTATIMDEEVNGTLELQLQLFDNSLSPASPKAHSFKLTKIDERYVSFKGISSGAHRTLSYERPQRDVFYIRFQPQEGDAIEIRLTPK